MPISRATEWSWILGAGLLLHLFFASFQPVTVAHGGLAYDGQHYYAMAQQTPRQLPPKADAPFVYRIGTPLLSAAVAKSLDWVIAAGFDRVNLAANVLTVILLTIWLQRHVASAAARILVVVFFMVEPHSPMRFAYYYPVFVDPAAQMFLVAGLVALDWFRERAGVARALGLTALVAAGVVFREVVLVIAVAALFTPRGRWSERLRAGAWLPLLGGGLALAAIHSWVIASNPPAAYSATGEVLRWLREKTPWQYAIAWFLVFGPLLVLPLVSAGTCLRRLRERPDWLVYVLAVAVLAWIGGSDTERILVFASPIVYLLMAKGVMDAGLAKSSPLLTACVMAQLISSRIFVPIGGPTAPPIVGTTEWNRLAGSLTWISTYDSLWSQFCGSSALLAYAVWYGVIGLAITAGVRARRSTRELERP